MLLARESGRPSGAAAALGLACWGLLLARPHDDRRHRLPAVAGRDGRPAGARRSGGAGRPEGRRAAMGPRGSSRPSASRSRRSSRRSRSSSSTSGVCRSSRRSPTSSSPRSCRSRCWARSSRRSSEALLAAPLAAAPGRSRPARRLAAARGDGARRATSWRRSRSRAPSLPFPLDLAGALIALGALLIALRRVRGRRARPTAAAPSTRPASGPPSRTRPGAGSAVRSWLPCARSPSSVPRRSRSSPGLAGPCSSPSSTSARATRSSSRRTTGRVSSSTAEATRTSSCDVSTSASRSGIVASTSCCSPTRTRTTSAGWPGCCLATGSACSPRTGCAATAAATRAFREQADRYGVADRPPRAGRRASRSAGRAPTSSGRRSGSVPETAPDSGTRDQRHLARARHPHRRCSGSCSRATSRRTWTSGSLEALERSSGRLDLLKVAHHGSATASSAPLLRALRPRLAVVSVGVDNDYGHPAPSTLARLEEVGARVLRTDLGTATIVAGCVRGAGRARRAGALDGCGASAPSCGAPRSHPRRPGAGSPATLGRMPVPTRSEAIRLLLAAGPSPRLMQHATVVAEVASFLAYRAQARGVRVDRRLVETAALLHDVDKAFRDDDPLKRYPHGRAGAEYVAAAGHPELARAVAGHPVMRLGDDDAEAWVGGRPARGAHRLLRRQARDPARRVARPALRALVPRASRQDRAARRSRTSAPDGWRRSSATRSASRRRMSSGCAGWMRREHGEAR